MIRVPKFGITVIHPNGDKRTLPVEYIAPSGSYIVVRWGAAGTYDLNLSKNTLAPSDCKTIPRGRDKAKWYRKSAPLWRAENIEEVRKLVAEHNSLNTRNETEEAINKHIGSMPK
jgi:hypothetical protein